MCWPYWILNNKWVHLMWIRRDTIFLINNKVIRYSSRCTWIWTKHSKFALKKGFLHCKNTHTAYWLVIKCPGVRKSELSAVRYLFHKHTHTYHNTSKHTYTRKHTHAHKSTHTKLVHLKKQVYNLTKHYWGPSILSLSPPPLICFYIHLSRSCCCNFLHLDASFISADCPWTQISNLFQLFPAKSDQLQHTWLPRPRLLSIPGCISGEKNIDKKSWAHLKVTQNCGNIFSQIENF